MEFIGLQTRENGVALITIKRPQALNALNRAVLQELGSVLERVSTDSTIKVLVITGKGRAFVAGADIVEMKDMSAKEAKEFAALGHSLFNRLATMPQPSIAAINGFALGGGLELALACDLRLASEQAKLGQPEIGLGIIPGFGATQRLPRLIGAARAKELLFTGKTISAAEALNLGLVNSLVPQDELLDTALALADQIAAKSAKTLQVLKEVVSAGLDLKLHEGLALEAERFADCFTTWDQKEGMSAFLEKRQPNFRDC
ncbi:MAG: crotonase [Firmicutes bacterium]|jgi:enoyl-CoA hydratase|nr:crotonase [Bacillota bacterium]